MRGVPTLILSNPLGADDAQEIGLEPREFRVGEIITVDDYVFATLVRTGYGKPFGTSTDVLLIGDGSPTDTVGVDGQWYLDRLGEVLWGPKAGGFWPADPIRPDRGVSTFAVNAAGHLIVTYSSGRVVDLGLVHGEGYGGGFVVAPPADPAQPLKLTVSSDFGVDAAGQPYWNATGAAAGEAALVMPDPYSGQFVLFQPGKAGPYSGPIVVAATAPDPADKTPRLHVQTGLGADGTGLTFWVETGD